MKVTKEIGMWMPGMAAPIMIPTQMYFTKEDLALYDKVLGVKKRKKKK